MVASKKKTKVSQEIDLLLELQEISQNLDNLVEEINQLKEEASKEEKKYAAKKHQYDKHYPYLEKVQKEHDQLKIALEDINKKIEESEEKKKKIKTIKEFKAINKEIDALNRQNAIKENDLLTKIEELEFKKDKIEKISISIEEIKETIDKKKMDLEILIKERKNSIAKYTKEKAKVESKLSDKSIRTFNRIYAHKENLAVVPVQNQVCHGCYMQVPLQNEINVKEQKSIVYCPNCSRILYVDQLQEELLA